MQDGQKRDISSMIDRAETLQAIFAGVASKKDSFIKVDEIINTYADVLDLMVGILENQQKQDKEIASMKASLAMPPPPKN